MDQDETWHAGRPWPRPHCLRWVPSYLPQRGTAPNFRPISAMAKWLDGSRWHLAWRLASARPHCARWGPSSTPQKGAEPPILGHLYCGQMARCIKMPLGTEVGLSPSNCVRWGPSSPSPKRWRIPPFFGPCLLWPNGCMYQDTTWYAGRPQPRRYCVRWGPSNNSPKGSQPPQFSASVRCS